MYTLNTCVFVCISDYVSGGKYVYVRAHVYVHDYFKCTLCYAALTLAVFCQSPATYEALKGFGLLQLPSHSTLQAYTETFMDGPSKLVTQCCYCSFM